MMIMDDTTNSITYSGDTYNNYDIYNYKIEVVIKEPDESRYGWNKPVIIGKPKQKIGRDIKRTIRSTLY